MKTERDELIKKLDILDDLTVWSSHALIRVRCEKDIEAVESIELIIAAMENPKVIENLKEVRDWLMVPF